MRSPRSVRAHRAALPLLTALAALLPAAGAAARVPYPGMKLNPNGATYVYTHSGPVFVRIYCPGQVFGDPRGFCTGTLELYLGSRFVASAPVASGDYDGPTMQVSLPGWFRARVAARGPQRVRVVIRSHDLQGLWRTTGGTITISAPAKGGDAKGSPAPPLPHIALSEPPPIPQIPAPPTYPDAPHYARSWGNPLHLWGSTAPGLFGGGRQAIGGDRPHDNPSAVWVDEAGTVWAADNSNNRIQAFTPDGVFQRSFGAYGFDPGSSRAVGAKDRFNNPINLVLAGGRAYVVDQRNDRVMTWNVAGTPRPLVRIGRRGAYPGRFVAPWDVALAKNGDVLVIDQANYRIQRFAKNGRYRGSFGRFGTGLGGFQMAWSLAVAADGRIYVLDNMRERVLVFSPGGVFEREFGASGTGAGELNRPQGIALDPQGRVVIANTKNRRIDRFTADGQFVDTFGWGAYTDPSPSTLDVPADVAVDQRNGTIYVAEAGNLHPKSGTCGRFRQPRPDPCRNRRIVAFTP